MQLPEVPERGRLLVVSFLLLFVPAVFLMVTLLILIIGRNILVNDLTLVRILELYLVKVVLFTLLLFVLYYILRNISEQQIPQVLDESDRQEYEKKTPENDRSEPVFDSDNSHESRNR